MRVNSRSLVRITLLCVLPLTSTACAWILVNGPPPNHERLNFFTCSQSRVTPGLDLVWSGFMVLGAVAVLAASDAEVERDFGYGNKGLAIGTYAGWGVLTGLSAASGFKKVGQCRDATALLMERLSRPPETPSATRSLEALVWRPPQLFPTLSSLDFTPIRLRRPKPKSSPGN